MRTHGICVLALALGIGLNARGQDLVKARAEAAAGHFSQAAELYRQVLKVRPQDTDALGGLVDALERSGGWREAMPYLQQLVEFDPQNARRIFQLGQWTSWTASGRAQALTLLKRATELNPSEPLYKAGYAEVLGRDASQRPTAIAITRQTVALDPSAASARRLLAKLLAAEGRRDEALRTLQPASDTDDILALGEVEQSTGHGREALAAFRRAHAADPNNLEAITRLAERLSWRDETQDEAGRLFELGLRLDPSNQELLVDYGNMLSWSGRSRTRALQLYERALALDPNNADALAGKANLLAWNGRTKEALALFDRALAADPQNVPALRGKGEALTWKGRYAEATPLLTRAAQLWPEDSLTKLRLARAELGQRHFDEARAAFGRVASTSDPDYSEVRGEIREMFGTWMETGLAVRRNRDQMNYYRPITRFSTPVGGERFTLGYRPTWYQGTSGDFNANYFYSAFDSDLAHTVTLHADAGANTYSGRPTQMDGGLELRFQPHPALSIKTGFRREAEDETLRSAYGETDPGSGLFLGPIFSNIGSLSGTYTNHRYGLEIGGGYNDGLYTGKTHDSNRRRGADFSVAKTLRASRPYLNISYGIVWLGWEYDASFAPGAGPLRQAGDYWSPRRFLLHYGALNFSHPLGKSVRLEAGGSLGAQSVTNFWGDGGRQFSYTFNSRLVWRAGARDELRIGYDLLNVYNAYRRSLPSITWRHYF